MKINLTPITVWKVEFLTFATQKDVQLIRELELKDEEVADFMNMTIIEIDTILRKKLKEDNIKWAKEYLELNNK